MFAVSPLGGAKGQTLAPSGGEIGSRRWLKLIGRVAVDNPYDGLQPQVRGGKNAPWEFWENFWGWENGARYSQETTLWNADFRILYDRGQAAGCYRGVRIALGCIGVPPANPKVDPPEIAVFAFFGMFGATWRPNGSR